MVSQLLHSTQKRTALRNPSFVHFIHNFILPLCMDTFEKQMIPPNSQLHSDIECIAQTAQLSITQKIHGGVFTLSNSPKTYGPHLPKCHLHIFWEMLLLDLFPMDLNVDCPLYHCHSRLCCWPEHQLYSQYISTLMKKEGCDGMSPMMKRVIKCYKIVPK